MISLLRYRNQTKLQRPKIAGKDEWKAWLDLKNTHFHIQLSIFIKETARGLPLPPLTTASDPIVRGGIPSFPLTTQV